MNTNIRLATSEDLEPLATLFAEAFTQADQEKPWDQEHALRYLTYCFERQPELFFVAEDTEKKELEGAAWTAIKPWRSGLRCTDGFIFTAIPHQHQGVAKTLAKKVLEEAVEKYNAETIEGITFAEKEFPLAWYKKIGMQEDTGAVFLKGNCKEILEKLEE